MDDGAHERVLKFCHDCQGKQKAELLAVVNEAVKEKDALCSLIGVVEHGYSGAHVSELESLYNALFHIYQAGYPQCQLFVLQFIPSLLSAYYVSEQRTTRTTLGRVEAVLLAIYNKDVIGQRETPFARSFRIPSLSKSSVYHEPFNWRASLLTETALSRHEQSDKPVLMSGPTAILSRIPAGYRFQVFHSILQEYNSRISAMSEASHIAFCKLSIRVALSGYSSSGLCSESADHLIDFHEIAKLERLPRLCLNAEVVKDLLAGLYFVMHNGLASYSKQALEALKTHCQNLLNIPGCMVAYGMCDIMETSSKQREKHDVAFVTNAFSCRRRSEGQGLPKSRKGSRPSGATKDIKDYVVIETVKRDELQVNRPMTRAISDSDIRMSRPMPQFNGERPGIKRITIENEIKNLDDSDGVKDKVVESDTNGQNSWSPTLVLDDYPTESSTDPDGPNVLELKVQAVNQNDMEMKVTAKPEIIVNCNETAEIDSVANSNNDEGMVKFDTSL